MNKRILLIMCFMSIVAHVYAQRNDPEWNYKVLPRHWSPFYSSDEMSGFTWDDSTLDIVGQNIPNYLAKKWGPDSNIRVENYSGDVKLIEIVPIGKVYLYDADYLWDSSRFVREEYLISGNAYKGKFVNGCKQGVWTTSGLSSDQPQKTISFINGKAHGLYRAYDKSGVLLYETIADSLKSWNAKSFYPNGALKSEGIYKESMKDSIWNFYNANGQLEESFLYSKNEMLKKLFPYDLDVDLVFEDSLINIGFVIIENAIDKSLTTQLLKLDEEKSTRIILRDTTGLNLYFCLFGHKPKLVTVENVDKRSVSLEKSIVYCGLAELGPYLDSVDFDAQRNGFNLPYHVNRSYNHTVGLLMKGFLSYSDGLLEFLSKSDILSYMKEGKDVDLYFYVASNGEIVNVESKGRGGGRYKRRLNRFLKSQYISRKFPNLYLDSESNYVYCVSLRKQKRLYKYEPRYYRK